MNSPVYIDGCEFEASIEHFSLGQHRVITEMAELRKLSQLENLRSASFHNTKLNDTGLAYVCEATSIENLDLQATEVTNMGLGSLVNLPRLKYLRLKENPQLTNECVGFLLSLENLRELGIHETSIDQEGLKELVGLQGLQDICLDDSFGNFTFEVLIAVSRQMPNCTILAKGKGEFHRGQFEGEWGE